MSQSRGETEEQIKKIGAGRVDLTTLLSDLILASVYCDGDLAAKSYMIKRLKETNPSDTELFGILLGLLEGTGRHAALAGYIREYLASLTAQPSTLGCWDPSPPKVPIENRHHIKVAIAVVGDSICNFASAPKKYTTNTVSACIKAAIQCELQNSAPRDMSPKERQEYVREGLDRYVVKDFTQGATQIQKPPQCRPDQSLHPMAIASQ